MSDSRLRGGPESWDEESFLNYMESHSKTEMALFHKDHVFRLLDLAGAERPNLMGNWYSVYWDEARPFVEKARERIRCKPTEPCETASS